jgi:hypothetical protein
VTLKDGATVTAKELIAFTRDRLAHYKCPDAIEFGPLPKTSTGKVQKYLLREQEWASREVRIGARGVHKLSRVQNPIDLQVDRISAPHGLYRREGFREIGDVEVTPGLWVTRFGRRL